MRAMPWACGEVLRAFADEVDMLAFFEDEAGGLDGVAEALDAGDAAGFHAAAVHEEGVELDAAVGGEEAAAAGIEGGIVFKDGDGGFDGVDGGAAEGEDGVAGFESAADAGLVGCGGIRRGWPMRRHERGGLDRVWLGWSRDSW